MADTIANRKLGSEGQLADDLRHCVGADTATDGAPGAAESCPASGHDACCAEVGGSALGASPVRTAALAATAAAAGTAAACGVSEGRGDSGGSFGPAFRPEVRLHSCPWRLAPRGRAAFASGGWAPSRRRYRCRCRRLPSGKALSAAALGGGVLVVVVVGSGCRRCR